MTVPDIPSLAAKAAGLGFDRVGVAAADSLEEELAGLQHWLADGRAGDMAWLAREPERRSDPRRVLDGCRSVVVLGASYLRPAEGRTPGGATGRVSKYALGRDYHRVLEKRLRKLARWLSAETGAAARPFVDYGPVMERPWAARAGLGFVGKHTLLIDENAGSFFFLGVVLSAAELEPTPRTPTASCGNCRACIDACPTGAITEPYRLDARRCLSYLTIEKQGPVAEESWPRYDRWVFGCDACQDVCPFNRKRARPSGAGVFDPPMVPAEWSLVDMLRLTEEDLAARFAGSPLRRAGADSLARNAAIVASETGGPEEARALDALASDDSRPEWLRATAARAAGKIRG